MKCKLFIMVVLMSVVVACGESVEVNDNPDLVYTQVAQTVIADYTQQADMPDPTIEPTGEQLPLLGSRENPVPINSPLALVYEEISNIEMRVVSIIRGDQAWQMIYDENMFNNPPSEGMEYMIAKLAIDYLTSEDPNVLLEFHDFDFKSMSNNQVFDGTYVICPEKLDVSLFPGGHGEGNIAVAVYSNDANPQIVFNKYLEDNMFFFSTQ